MTHISYYWFAGDMYWTPTYGDSALAWTLDADPRFPRVIAMSRQLRNVSVPA